MATDAAAICPAGTVPIAGGYGTSAAAGSASVVADEGPDANAWSIIYNNRDALPQTIHAVAVCATVSG